MSESTLSLGYPELRAEIGDFMGIGRTTGSWSTENAAKVEAILTSAIRQFYVPPPLPNQTTAHKWSFLHPVTTLTCTVSDYDYDLPDDFGALESEFTFDPDEAYSSSRIRTVNESQIRTHRQLDVGDGVPRMAAVRPLTTTGSSGQRWEVLFWPSPDTAYVLSYRYMALPGKLTTALPYPLGGMPHAETVLSSCLAIAEQRMHGERGQMWSNFLERLAASILHDRQHEPSRYGYNGDLSEDAESGSGYYNRHRVTYDGTEWD